MKERMDHYLDTAYIWLCRRRKSRPPNDEVWHLRHNWVRERPRIRAALLTGKYQFAPVRHVRGKERDHFLWEAADALVLKVMAQYLETQLSPVLSPRIFHLAGKEGNKRGLKAAVNEIANSLPNYHFVYRTDVKNYYASIRHELLWPMLEKYIPDPPIKKLMRLFLTHTVNREGMHQTVRRGLSQGCPISGLLGALFLQELDAIHQREDLMYLRYMDDWIILTRSRWALRRAIQQTHQVLKRLKLELRPEKTDVGRVEKGFDFLGYHFSLDDQTSFSTQVLLRQRAQESTLSRTPPITDVPATKGTDGFLSSPSRQRPLKKEQSSRRVLLPPADKTIQNFLHKLSRLYEQGADIDRIGSYVQAWWRWCWAGVLAFTASVFDLEIHLFDLEFG